MNRRRASRWFALLMGTGVLQAALFAGSALSPLDREALAYAILTTAAVALAWWRPMAGAAVLGALYLNAAAWMIPAAANNAGGHIPLSSSLLPGLIGISAAVGAIGAAGTLLGREGRWGPVVVFGGGVAVLVVLLASASLRPTHPVPLSDIEMITADMEFDPVTVDVEPGRVSVRVRNEDLFWHTFTIRELGVDVSIPARGERKESFVARPGTYELICAIPGHAQLGMRGTVRVG